MTADKKLRICLASSELAPLAKTGGLADVVAALSAHLHESGHDVRVLMPRYARLEAAGIDFQPVDGLQDVSVRLGSRQLSYSIDRAVLPEGLPVHFLRCAPLFGRDAIYTQDGDEHQRFILLSRAALEMCQRMGFAPDIVHCHDWHTALMPLYLRTVYAWDRLFEHTRTVLTIHNIGYQGIFPADRLADLGLGDASHHLHQDDLQHGRINCLKTGILYADAVTTVSPTYAREIQGETYGMGLQDYLSARSDSVIGILNGVDGEWNPQTDPLIPRRYSPANLSGKAGCKRELMKQMGLEPAARRPLVGLVSRLVGQKGIDLIEQVVPGLLAHRDFALVALGSGEPRYEHFFDWLQHRFPDRVAFYRGYNEQLAHWIEAGSDVFLMPSLYEPCGLNQMYSLIYGTVPVVRETGGLADTVQPVDPATGTGTGIVFKHYDGSGLAWALTTALDLYPRRRLWRKIIRNGMQQDFSWQRQGARYVELFRNLSGRT